MSDLTPREAQVVRLIGAGQLYKQAAEVMGCTPRTVRAHVSSAAEKLRASLPYQTNNVRFAPHTVVRLHDLEGLRKAGGLR